MCNLQANTDTLTSYFEELVLGSISIQALERRVAYFTFACPGAMAGQGCQLVIVQPKRGITSTSDKFCVEEAKVARPLLPARGRLLGPRSDMLKKPAKTFMTT